MVAAGVGYVMDGETRTEGERSRPREMVEGSKWMWKGFSRTTPA